MGREYAYAYKSNARPYGQPKDNFHESTPRPEGVGLNRNVRQVMDTSVNVASPETPKCKSLTRSGEPCKGRPASGNDLCSFHRK